MAKKGHYAGILFCPHNLHYVASHFEKPAVWRRRGERMSWGFYIPRSRRVFVRVRNGMRVFISPGNDSKKGQRAGDGRWRTGGTA